MSENISEIDKKLNAILGITYEEETTTNQEIVVQENNNEIETVSPEIITDLVPINQENILDQSDIDFEFARQNIKKLSDIGMENIEKLSYIARDSQTPRMFEVLSGMIKNISDINSNLIDIHNKKISTANPQEEPTSSINVNQAIICTGSEMLKRIKDRKK